MKFYIIAIECFFLTIASFSFLTGTRFRPPEKWGEAPYYRTKLAKKIYVKIDKTVFKGMRFDLFHLACFHFYFLCLIISTICSVIDLLTFFALTKLFGTSLLLIIFIILALLLFCMNSLFALGQMYWTGNRNVERNLEKKQKPLKD